MSIQKTDLTQSAKARELCLQYSEQPDRLREWLSNNSVYVSSVFFASPDWDKKQHATVSVNINGGESFMFYLSIADTAALDGMTTNGSELPPGKAISAQSKVYGGLLYSILCCIACDIGTDISSFECFCAEMGYDTDSRNAEKTFNAVKAQMALLLKSGLNETDCEFLPA